MNIISNSGAKVLGRLAFLGLCAWALAGCSDQGPVNLFAPELFNHHIGGPNLAYYSASSTNFTTNSGSNSTPPPNTTSALQMVVNIANIGGAGTYEPISVTFTSTDCHVVWDYDGAGSGLYGSNNAWAQPANFSQNYALAVSPQGAGTSVPASAQSFVQLYQGYYNGSVVVANSGISVAFYYAPNGSCSTCTPTIDMAITDGLGNKYSSSFSITIVQSNPGSGNGTNDCPF